MFILVMLCAVGGFFGLPNPWLHFPPAALLFPFALTWIAWRSSDPRQAFRLGWLGGFAALNAMFYWTAVPVHFYGGFPWWLAPVAPMFISSILGFYFAFYGALMHTAARKLSAVPLIVCAGVLWFMAEHLNSYVLSGFPWNALASGFSAWPATVQGVSLIGVYGLSGVLAALAVAFLLVNTARSAWVVALLIIAFLAGYGPYRMSTFELEETDMTLALVQGNLDQAVKWDLAFQDSTVERYENLTDSALNRHTVDLAVWPETALPFYLQEKSSSTMRVHEYLHRSGVALLTGAPAYESSPDKHAYDLRNRAFLFDAEAATVGWYDKEHLVPFGEYMPFPDWLGIDKLAQGVGDYTPGENEHKLRLGPAELGVFICYEAIFPDLGQKLVEKGANVFVNISNDAWFGDSSAPLQHLAHAQLRSIEQNRWLARATNNGITVFIDPLGRIVAQAPRNQATVLTHAVKPVEVTTVYHDIYHWELRVLYLLAGAFIAWIIFAPGRKQDKGRWKL